MLSLYFAMVLHAAYTSIATEGHVYAGDIEGARGRTGGRPKGLTESAEKKATAAAALYSKGELSVNEIAENLSISKATLYKYLRHRRIDIGHVQKPVAAQKPRTLKSTCTWSLRTTASMSVANPDL